MQSTRCLARTTSEPVCRRPRSLCLEDDMGEIIYLVGLDLGQPRTFTALAILERTRPAEPMNQSVEFRVTRHWDGLNTVREPVAKRESTYADRHLERFPLGTPYPKICERLVELF